MAIACSCHAVRDHVVAEVIVEAGAETVEQISEHCSAGSRCGGCHPTLERLLEELGLGTVSAA